MNNDQFRRLLLDNTSSNPSKPTKDKQSSPVQSASQSHASRPGPSNGALGSRMRSSIPMTPRTLTNPDFARQLSDYRRENQGGPPNKKFRSSAAPKGTKLPTGYVDRAAQLRGKNDDEDTPERGEEGEKKGDRGNDDIGKRIQALEEMVKLGQIDEGTFTRLRKELGVGGDVGSTHMVKGLDWDLLRRVRAGEDVNQREKGDETKEEEEEEVVDVDEEFDRVLEGIPDQEKKEDGEEKKKKKGNMAPPPVRKTRDEILRELKASRAAAAVPQPSEPALGAKFKRIGDSSKVEKKRFIEQDENGRRREVLLVTDAEGKTKRKVRWLDKPGVSGSGAGLLVPDKAARLLGMEVPAEIASKAKASLAVEEDEDDDIFAGVGADYNPLADLGEDSDSDSDEDGEVDETRGTTKVSTSETKDEPSSSTGQPAAVGKPRNYFAATDKDLAAAMTTEDRSNPLTKDPVLLAALKRAAALRQASASGAEGEEGEAEEAVDRDTLLRRKKFLEEAQRQEALDAMDMDLGFGSSRIEDDEDDEPVMLEGDRGSKKRKRGPKKKKGDKDSAADVLSVLEGRKR